MTTPERPEELEARESTLSVPQTWRKQDADGPTTLRETGPVRRRVLTTLPSALEGRYRIVEELRGGGEARVLLAEDSGGIRVVIKIYGDERFAAKADVLERVSQLQPEHVVRLIEHDVSDGWSYEVVEYLPLGTLAELMAREGPQLPPERVKEVLSELAAALAHIHDHWVEYKDLKPSNVLVRTGRPLDLALTDFGIAETAEHPLRISTFIGATLAYAPPEAFAQVAEKNEASGAVKRKVLLHSTKWDFWSLGVMLVEMLSGRHPFDGCNDMTIVSRLATQNVDDLVAHVSDPDWRKLCCGLLRRDPKERWGKSEIDKWLANSKERSLTVADDAQVSRPDRKPRGRTDDGTGGADGDPD